jgi:ribonuclease BN (tRNA processing enzyme)
MSVRLTVIGCSPAWPNPGSAHSGYLLESATGGRLLLDCGPGVLPRLLAHDSLPVDAIVISHFHLDHWGDLVPWAWLRLHGSGAGAPPSLWIPPEGRDDLRAFETRWGTDGMFEQAFAINEYGARRAFSTAGFELEAHAVEHYGFPAFGLRVRNGGRTLGYSGDSGPCEGIASIARGADLFLCEATIADGARDGPPRGHLSPEEALDAAEGRTILTHRPATLPLPPGVERATDGLVVDV